jgi:hypothetical protein
VIRVKSKVRAKRRRGVGVVLRHHPHLPAWQVRFPGDRTPLYWFEAFLEELR